MNRLAVATAFLPFAAFAQGPLPPPAGPPVASMKTLDQIESRTAIPKGPAIPVVGPHFTISQPGSYYLTGNITVSSGVGILIECNDVTLDLGGFTIASTSAAQTGWGVAINGNSRTNIAISNGTIRGTTTFSSSYSGGGFTEGIGAAGVFGGSDSAFGPTGIRVKNIAVSGVGTGIALNPNSPSNLVESCTVNVASFNGIRAGVVSDSSAIVTGGTCIEAKMVSNVAGTRTTPGPTVIPAPPAADTRTQIASAPYTISQGGSYVLTGNLTVSGGNGININASNVTLDLNGFALISRTVFPAAGNAIQIADNQKSIEIKNGSITGGAVRTAGARPWLGTYADQGWQSGIVDSASSSGVTLSHLTVDQCKGYGIQINGTSVMEHITATSNGLYGIYAYTATVSNVSVSLNGIGGGIYLTNGSVSNASVNYNGGDGIYGTSDNVSNVSASYNGRYGIYGYGSSVTNCRATGNGKSGIAVSVGVVAHCVASGNSTDTTTTDKEIDVSPGGQRDACVPASE